MLITKSSKPSLEEITTSRKEYLESNDLVKESEYSTCNPFLSKLGSKLRLGDDEH